MVERGIHPTVCVAYFAGGISVYPTLRAASPFGAGETVAGAASVGARPGMPEPEEFLLWNQQVELFGEDEINRCPYCGAAHSLHRVRDELDAPTWIQRLVLDALG